MVLPIRPGIVGAVEVRLMEMIDARVDFFPLFACWLRVNFGQPKKVVAVGSGQLAVVCGVVTGDWLSGL